MRPFEKPALSVEQQLELLKQRGLHVANDDRAMRFLEVVTLFRLSPYMRPFQKLDPEHTFRPGSTLKAVVDIYRFDGSLRRITMDAIERVEVAIRATISNHMSFKYGPDWIADASIFSMSYSHSGLLRSLRDQLSREQNKLGREIDRIKKSVQPDGVQKQRIENRMRDNYFRFYGSTYARPELPPAWAVLEELSLGTHPLGNSRVPTCARLFLPARDGRSYRCCSPTRTRLCGIPPRDNWCDKHRSHQQQRCR
ncbi:Abi family protein [Pseudomonas viridiflava]|uniref:Abi family protein n=1 Tax=Pseudomonas viridiflava TaxID=33069 RepID=UPI001FD1A5A5|nr:Abi family protein [Pseudomonas viridiflava]